MAINLSNFVNVNINYHLSSIASSTRDTAVLIVQTGIDKDDVLLESLSDAETLGKTDARFDKETGNLYYYAHCFFSNGGIKLLVKYVTKPDTYSPASGDTFNAPTYFKDASGINEANPANCFLYEAENVASEDTAFNSAKTYYTNAEATIIATPENANGGSALYVKINGEVKANDIISVVNELDINYIVYASDTNYIEMIEASKTVNGSSVKGARRKLLLTSFSETPQEGAFNEVPNGLCVKYGTAGIEMTIAAYLTQIDVDKYNSVKDYDFTIESVTYKKTDETVVGTILDDNDTAVKYMKANINFDASLVNETREIGGNDTNGKDIVNEYMLILLHQTLTERLTDLLTQKIKYNNSGLSLIGATISKELQRYLNNGYLTTDKVWTDPDLVYDGITIISQNTPLKNGYKYMIMPLYTLSEEDRRAHKLPDIYVLIADSYSIREINIDGEVF